MFGFFILVFLLLLVFLIASLIKPQLMSSLFKRPFSRKQIGLYVGAATLLFFILAVATTPPKETTPPSNQAALTEPAKTQPIQTQTAPPPDTTPPEVSDIKPTASISTSTATITASYSDPASGIDKNSVSVQLDGTALTGCTITETSVSCPASSLADGQHSVSINVSDTKGNKGVGTATFTVATPPPPAPTPEPTPQPAPQTGPPAGATALCNDGTYSYSQHRSGTCSHHGGVAQWLADLP